MTILCKLWHAKGKDVIANLRDRPFFPRKVRRRAQRPPCIPLLNQPPTTPTRSQLVDVNWRLHLELASSAEAKPKLPNALFELAVSSKDKARTEVQRISSAPFSPSPIPPPPPSQADADRVQMEFTHAELYDFYNKLEMIQKQLDQLG